MQYDFLSDLIINDIRVATTSFTETGACASRTNRSNWAILLKFEGQTIYQTPSGEEFISDIDNIVVLPKGCSYKWKCTKAGHFIVIEFDADKIFDSIITFKNISGEKILKAMQEIELCYLSKSPTNKLKEMRGLYALFADLLESAQKSYIPHSKEQKLSPATQYIAKNYNENITNAKLAKLTGLSEVYFRKLFKEIYKTSPINFVHELRVKKAKAMLKTDYSRITDIALALGYCDIYDFSRDFKKHTGFSPKEYAKTSRK